MHRRAVHRRSATYPPVQLTLVVLAASASACQAASAENFADTDQPRADDASGAALHDTTIELPASLRGVPTGERAPTGAPVVVACGTCHNGEPAALPAQASEVAGPHTGLVVQHGGNTCGSCHDPSRRDRLRLADGQQLELTEAMQLCSQCHGTQRRDYDHGAHGGMAGHWDLARGPRTRNHCIHCHDPHVPAYPRVLPAAPPRDRFFGAGARHE